MTKPTIVISACLNNHAFRYNGTSANDEIVNKIKFLFKLIDVCPEVSIGLGIPRKPIKLNKFDDKFKVIQEETNIDLTEKFEKFSYEFINNNKNKIYGAILKAKSPSCGVANCKYYVDGKIQGRTYGIFARILKATLPYIPLTDEVHLRNKQLLWEFLTKVFMFFRFENSKYDINSLIEFHSRHKYILMGISQKHLKILGQILAKHNGKNFLELRKVYEEKFKEVLKLNFKKSNLVNTITHIFGHISKSLNSKEKNNFIKMIEKYRNGNLDFNLLIEILRVYALRFNNEYLLSQFFLNPYPEIE
ncbi:MAG: DUF523 and DUF1722 domain-containing protein [Elusimicrobiota bacterium]|nr:DUF523 and DUF1722 domain-containing protein [Endomicrobiia bacterium]MDW8166671.1 DUF523 and DUF1722 domain-containing protein [Elusimicrobiota bacterium]